MPFNFATGKMENASPTVAPTRTPSVGGGSTAFNFATGQGGTVTQDQQIQNTNQQLPNGVGKTLGGNLVRGLIRPFVRGVNTLIEPISKASGEHIDYNNPYLGDISGFGMKEGQTTGQRVKDVLGGALELGSYFIGVGEVDAGINAAKTVAETGARSLGRHALGGLAAGAVGGAGAELQNPNSTVGSVAKNAAIGGAAGGILGGILGGISHLLANKAPKEIVSILSDENKVNHNDIIDAYKGQFINTRELAETIRERVGVNKRTADDVAERIEELHQSGKEISGQTLTDELLKGKTLSTEQLARIENQKPVEYDPYTPDNELPTIDYGKPGKESVPTIQLNEQPVDTRMPGYKYIPNEGFPTSNPTEQFSQSPDVASPIEKIPELSTKIKEDLTPEQIKNAPQITQDQYEEHFGDKVKQFDRQTWENNVKETAKISPEDREKIALGYKNAPDGVDNTFVWTEVRNQAKADGDGELLNELSKSPNSPSQQGQSLQFSKNAKGGADMDEALHTIKEARGENAYKNAIKKELQNFKNIIKKSKIKVEQLKELLNCE